MKCSMSSALVNGPGVFKPTPVHRPQRTTSVQLSRGTTRNFQLLLEYFHGKSPNGQFYVNNVEYVGIGGHLHF